MERTANRITFEEGEAESLAYWADLPVSERFEKTFEWNRKVWGFLQKKISFSMDKTIGGKRMKAETDEDDF